MKTIVITVVATIATTLFLVLFGSFLTSVLSSMGGSSLARQCAEIGVFAHKGVIYECKPRKVEAQP
jgi:hypothetical protein